MPLIWRPQMSIGNALVDADHRYLICLANTVEIALRGSPMVDVLEIAFDELELYARNHFAREEELMIALGYARYDGHKRAHQELAARFAEVRYECEQLMHSTSGKDGGLGEKTSSLHRHWLREHLLHEDMLLKPLFESRPYNYAV